MSVPRPVRGVNNVRVLQRLRRGEALSRADLARALGLNRSSVTHLVNELLAEELVRETGRLPASGGGRPATGLALAPGGAAFLGGVLSRRLLRARVLDLCGEVVAEARRPLAPRTPPEAALAALAATMGEAAARAERAGWPRGRLRGVGVALPGIVTDGVLRWAPMLDWREVPVAALLAPALEARGLPLAPPAAGGGDAGGAPLLLDNDANASALAELVLGEHGAARHLFYLYLEEGVGGGVVVDGAIYRGAFGAAGEVGKLLLGPAPPPALGREAMFGGRVDAEGLVQLYREAGGEADEAEAVVAAFEAGEAEAGAAVSAWGGWLARGLFSVAKLLNPERIVLGGPLSALLPAVLPQLDAALARASSYPGDRVRVAEASFGVDAGVMGAATLGYHAFFTVPDPAAG